MTDFSDAQEARDQFNRGDVHNPIGEECRRWSTCNCCGVTSPEMVFYGEIDEWQDDHDAMSPTIGGCAGPRTVRVFDDVTELWPHPEILTYTRHIEPAGEFVPVAKVYDPAWAKQRRRAITLDLSHTEQDVA